MTDREANPAARDPVQLCAGCRHVPTCDDHQVRMTLYEMALKHWQPCRMYEPPPLSQMIKDATR